MFQSNIHELNLLLLQIPGVVKTISAASGNKASAASRRFMHIHGLIIGVSLQQIFYVDFRCRVYLLLCNHYLNIANTSNTGDYFLSRSVSTCKYLNTPTSGL